MSDRLDRNLRAALHDAASGVRPHRGVEEIAARLEDRGRSRGWLFASGAAAIATALVIGGVSWVNHQAGKPNPTTAAPGADLLVTAYYVGNTAAGEKLFVEHHQMHDVTAGALQAAVSAALAEPDDPDYHSGFPRQTTATATLDGDMVTVDFDDPRLATTPHPSDADAEEAIQAIVWTVNAAEDHDVQVRFTLDGKPAPSLLGKVLSGPVSEGTADTLLSPVSVDVDEGASLAPGSLVSGKAATFEGTVVWQLRQGEQVVRHGIATASQCCTLSAFSFRLDAPPGSYTLVVHDTDPSGREGDGITTDSKDIVIQ